MVQHHLKWYPCATAKFLGSSGFQPIDEVAVSIAAKDLERQNLAGTRPTQFRIEYRPLARIELSAMGDVV